MPFYMATSLHVLTFLYSDVLWNSVCLHLLTFLVWWSHPVSQICTSGSACFPRLLAQSVSIDYETFLAQPVSLDYETLLAQHVSLDYETWMVQPVFLDYEILLAGILTAS